MYTDRGQEKTLEEHCAMAWNERPRPRYPGY